MGFIVNSSDLQQIAIALIESKAFWGTVAAGIWAFTKRHNHKTIIIEKDGCKIKASGMSQQDLEKSLEGAQNMIIALRDKDDEKLS